MTTEVSIPFKPRDKGVEERFPLEKSCSVSSLHYVMREKFQDCVSVGFLLWFHPGCES